MRLGSVGDIEDGPEAGKEDGAVEGCGAVRENENVEVVPVSRRWRSESRMETLVDLAALSAASEERQAHLLRLARAVRTRADRTAGFGMSDGPFASRAGPRKDQSVERTHLAHLSRGLRFHWPIESEVMR